MKDYSVDLNRKVESLEKQLKSKPTIKVFNSSENITDRIKTIEEKLNKTPASNEADIYIIGDSNTGKINADTLNNNIKCKKVWGATTRSPPPPKKNIHKISPSSDWSF